METAKRLYGSTPVLTQEQLISAFKSMPEVKLALLFGSRAVGTETLRSDYDFAVLPSDMPHQGWGIIADIYNQIGDKLALADYDFDVVDLRRADDAVMSGIRAGYIGLKGTENELRDLLK
jgi:predicted nucleotidyltransferase